MNSKTDYRRLASHHRGLYFVTPTRDEVSKLFLYVLGESGWCGLVWWVAGGRCCPDSASPLCHDSDMHWFVEARPPLWAFSRNILPRPGPAPPPRMPHHTVRHHTSYDPSTH